MDAFSRAAKRNYVSRGGGAGQDHADEMMALERVARDSTSSPWLEAYEADRKIRKMIGRWLLIVGAVLLVAFVLAGCMRTPLPSKCPPVKEYDEEFTNRFRAQLPSIPEGSPVAVYLLDAKTLREQVRACQ